VLAVVASAQSDRYPAPQDVRTIHVAMLYRGPNYAQTSASADLPKLQAAHLAHLTKLAKDGHALIAGPIEGGGDLAGIVMLTATSSAAARAFEAEDPAVKAGRFRIEMVSYMTPGNWFTVAPVQDNLPMRTFVFGFLRTADSSSDAAMDPDKLQDDHLANLWAMRQAGALVSAGPAIDGGPRSGVLVMTVDSLDAARALLAHDPSVKQGRLKPELYIWHAADKILIGKSQDGQTALCEAVATRVRAATDVGAGTRTVWSLLTKAPAPMVEVASVRDVALERDPPAEERWQFEKRMRSLYGNVAPVLKDLLTWDDFEIFALPGSAVRMVLTTGGTGQCESRYFFKVTTAREVFRVPDPPDKTSSDVATAICENDGAWGYFGRVGGTEAFLEYRTADAAESVRIVPLKDTAWQPACTMTAQFESGPTGRGRLRTVQVAAGK
jgi:uncharacterized protein YciI